MSPSLCTYFTYAKQHIQLMLGSTRSTDSCPYSSATTQSCAAWNALPVERPSPEAVVHKQTPEKFLCGQ